MKIFRSMILCLLILALLAPTAMAGTLSSYTLIAGGKKAALGSSTGYIVDKSGVTMVPIARVCELFDLDYQVSGSNGNMTITALNGKKVEVKPGARAMRVNGKTYKLRKKSYLASGQHLTVDVKVLKALGLSAKRTKKGKTTKKLGYPSGALSINLKGASLKLPSLKPVTEPTGVTLPSAAQNAAKTATQIVTVRQTSGSIATLTFYEKSGDSWGKTLSTTAYLGSKGIGKTKEGDKKTPTGTFTLKQPFGIKADPGTQLGSYLKVNKYHYWSGQNGKYYNKLVDTSKVSYKPTKADEHLIDYKGVYNYGMLINYNPDGESGKGSAIFLHCSGSRKYTAGCIAVSESVMIKLLKALKPGAKIVIYK